MKHSKVLLVDDEVDFTKVLSQRLEARGLEVEIANNGVQALEKIGLVNYDIILLDLRMPEMDGMETLKRLHKERPDLQVVLLTGQGDLKSGVEAMKLGATDFLEKPADIKELMEKIKDAKTQKAILVEKKAEESIQQILGTKGW
jgi:DNA-binding NtrC family response regulator